MLNLKKTGFIFALTLSALTFNITALAYTIPDMVRVGISSFANKGSITISNSSLYVGSGADYDRYEDIGIIESSGDFTIQLPEGYYVDCMESFDTYEEAWDYVTDYDDYGYDAYPAMTEEESWTIYISNIISPDEAEEIADEIDGYAIINTNRIIEIADDRGLIALCDGIWPQFAPESDKYISLGSKNYRGYMEFGRYNGGNITAVNVISMDEYLYSVVPAEMPYTWNDEALKAQIIAAKSYACTRLSAHEKEGYGLCDGTNCQVYNGVNSEKENVNDLVDEVSGILATYDGEPINAVYCSSSGGHTDNCENVWTATVPYLRGVKEIFGTKGTTWSRTYTDDEIAELCEKDGVDVGRVDSIDITCSTLTGRVQKMTINGSRRSHTVSKDGIRSFFSSNGGYLPSRLFTLNGLGVTDYEGAVYTEEDDDVIILTAVTEDIAEEYDISKVFVVGRQKFALEGNYTPVVKSSNKDSLIGFTASGSSYNFSGTGNGHGIGLSQHGANEMAENGYDYEEILKHYYTGIEVR